LVAFLRMIFCPGVALLLIKLSHAADLVPNGEQVLLITLLATMTPAASTITQFAQLFRSDAEYAGSINILTTLICIVTMPMFVALYYL
ncbi:MAG TPA: AEC family transporter, partial [Candidatus Fusicatenibacter merdavium]|nr:AEC family transporter [Candidatus Fusicatenibacter merdavium]